MTDVERAQLRALRATVTALGEQLDALLQETPAPPRATYVLPERCDGHEDCALIDEESRQDIGSMADPQAWRCVGCRHEETAIHA